MSNEVYFGRTKSPDGQEIIEVTIQIRQDSQIPEFDVVTHYEYKTVGFQSFEKFHEKFSDIVNEHGGMFVDDILKLKDRDIFSLVGEDVHPKDIFPIPALKAVKKAIVEYFTSTGQTERLKRATEQIICKCRHVSDIEIQEAMKKGHNTFERVQMATGAGTGCNTCVDLTKTLVEKYKKIS